MLLLERIFGGVVHGGRGAVQLEYLTTLLGCINFSRLLHASAANMSAPRGLDRKIYAQLMI